MHTIKKGAYMKNYDLNTLPELLKKKELSLQEAVNYLCEFILNNKPLFNLQRCDEDFISEIIIHFLENGPNFINNYDKSLGNFSAYFYKFMLTSIHSQKKLIAKRFEESIFYFQDYIISNEEKNYTFKPLQIEDKPKIPYAFKPVTPEQIREMILPHIDKIDRKILILTIRSAYYLSDEQIHKICSIYDVKEEYLFILVEYIRTTLSTKEKRRNEMIERRNKAYFYHKKYESQIKFINDAVYINEPEQLKEDLIRKNLKHTTTWQTHNQKLQDGCLLLRPSNKLIADLLGICERQVMYYLYCTKHQVYFEKTEKQLLKQSMENEL